MDPACPFLGGVSVRLYERESALGGRLGAARLGEHWVGLGTTYVKAKDPLFKAPPC